MKLCRALVPSGLMLTWFLQPLSARKGCVHLKEQTDDVPKMWYQGWFIFTHSTVPTGIYTKLQISESISPHGNIHIIRYLRAVFLLIM